MDSAMDNIKIMEITRVEDGTVRTVLDSIITEFSLSLYLNGRHFVNMLCTPDNLDAMVYGYLFTEGLIRKKDELECLSIKGNKAEAVLAFEPNLETVRAITTGLAPQKTSAYNIMPASEYRLPDGYYLSVGELLDNLKEFNMESSLFSATGGVHSCALCGRNGKRIFMEDIGRHNAFDKALGRALMDDWQISQTYLLTSGRVPGYMVFKALRTGLPIVISRSAPTDKAVEFARISNMTLCGFTRGGRLNIYIAPQRILMWQSG